MACIVKRLSISMTNQQQKVIADNAQSHRNQSSKLKFNTNNTDGNRWVIWRHALEMGGRVKRFRSGGRWDEKRGCEKEQ